MTNTDYFSITPSYNLAFPIIGSSAIVVAAIIASSSPVTNGFEFFLNRPILVTKF